MYDSHNIASCAGVLSSALTKTLWSLVSIVIWLRFIPAKTVPINPMHISCRARKIGSRIICNTEQPGFTRLLSCL